jgi:16S rRNA (adenine1518-N6/adenine1519-N6)-dimethyltransferase
VGRRLGQHFLDRRPILERIARAACPEPEPLVIEIGPGRGSLTGRLLARAGRVVAIERDRALVGDLAGKYSSASNLTLVHADVLETDLTQWGPAVVAGNLPYYITSPILRKVLALGGALRRAVFLVQKEVAERLTARPGARAYGFLTVQTALYARAELLFTVSASAFSPPPKVDSALVRLTPHAHPEPDAGPLAEFVGLCFRQKRKTLRNNLAGFCDAGMLAALPEASRRAEQLSVDEFRSLYRRLKRAGGKAAPQASGILRF